jgi:hypothetical protein
VDAPAGVSGQQAVAIAVSPAVPAVPIGGHVSILAEPPGQTGHAGMLYRLTAGYARLSWQ